MTPIKKQTSNLFVRRLKHDDIDILINICRKSFPDGIRGQNPRFLARRWWRDALSSASSETWVCSVGGEVAGFVILVTDNIMYAREKRKRSSSFFVRVCTAITCPRLLLWRFFKKMATCRWFHKHHVNSTRNDPTLDNCAWIEPIAVSPHMRRQGIAKKLLQHCENRALELKRSAIKVGVELQNKPTIELYKKSGFVPLRQTGFACAHYVKELGN